MKGYLILLVAVVTSLAARAANPEPVQVRTPAGEQFRFDAASAAPIVSYRMSNPLVAHYGALELDIFGDGRVVATRPEYMTNAGTQESRLSPAELRDLMAKLLSTRVSSFAGRALADRDGELFTVLDGDQVSVELQLLAEHADGALAQTTSRIVGEAPIPTARAGVGGAAVASLASADELLRKLALKLTSSHGLRRGQR